jgi:hypothetical protein
MFKDQKEGQIRQKAREERCTGPNYRPWGYAGVLLFILRVLESYWST